MDTKITVVTEQTGHGFFLAQFKTSQLAIFSYYIESQGQAVLVDPTFDVKVYNQYIAQRQATLKYVLLTHYHADFLSGHTQLKVPIIMGKNSKRNLNTFELHEYEDGASFTLGNVSVQVIHTPGHTLESSCFLLKDSEGESVSLLTGDTVFLGEVGRPDLAANKTLTTSDLAGLLFDSVQKLKLLKDEIRVYPAHGAGSACGKAIGGGNFCTLGVQKTSNYGFKFTDRQDFIRGVTDGMQKPPKYFFYDAQLNQKGPTDYQQVIKNINVPLSVVQFKALSQNIAIIDTRNDIGLGLIKNAYWLPSKGAITSWLSNIITPHTQFLLFTQAGKWEQIAQRFLRIGYFNIKGYNSFDIADWKEELNQPVIANFQLYKSLNHFIHLDVRGIPQFNSAGIIQNSILIPLPQLPDRVAELKDYQHIVISCRSGLRARVAYSILIKHDINSTIFSESFDQFAANGLKIVPFQ